MTHPTLTRRGLLLGGAASVLGLTAALSWPREAKSVTRAGLAFGTTVTLTLVDDGRSDIQAAGTAAFAALRAVERAATLFDPTSELSTLNRQGYLEAPSPILRRLVSFGLELARSSGGAFDPTVQPLWTLWRRARRAGRQPTDREIRETLLLVNHRGVRLDGWGITLARPGMGVTLNGLAQGYAADLALAALAAHDVPHALVDTGEFGALGQRPDGAPWRLSLPAKGPRAVLSLGDRRFLSTSADDRTTWTADHREHHVMDPRRGHSPRHTQSVTVESSSGLMADGLSTALMVTGRGGATPLLALDPGAKAHWTEK